MARAMLMLQGMSSSTEDEAPGKRRLQSPEEGAGPSQWTVKRPRTGSATAAEIGALVDGSSQQQRSDRHTQAISPAPSAGQAFCTQLLLALHVCLNASKYACWLLQP